MSDELYVCFVKDCWESWPISYHRTKAGAWRAGRRWIQDRFIETRNYLPKGQVNKTIGFWIQKRKLED